MPLTRAILENFWDDINEINFPISYKYFLESLNGEIICEGETVCKSNLTTHHIGNILSLRNSNMIELKRENIVVSLQSYNHLINTGLSIYLINIELQLLSLYDFNNFKISNLNHIISIPNLIFKKYGSIDNYKKDDQNVSETRLIDMILKKVFDYLLKSSKYLGANKSLIENLVIDEYDYKLNQLMIKTHFDRIPRKCICQFYTELEFEYSVNYVLRELLDIAYYREYRKNIKSISDRLHSKEVLEMETEMSF